MEQNEFIDIKQVIEQLQGNYTEQPSDYMFNSCYDFTADFRGL